MKEIVVQVPKHKFKRGSWHQKLFPLFKLSTRWVFPAYSWSVVYVHPAPLSPTPGPKSWEISRSFILIQASFPPWKRKSVTTPGIRFCTQALPSTSCLGRDLTGLSGFKDPGQRLGQLSYMTALCFPKPGEVGRLLLYPVAGRMA